MNPIFGVTIKKDIWYRYLSAATRNALKLSVVFIGGLLFLMLMFATFQMILFLIATAHDPMNQKVVSSGYQNRTEEELKARHRYHGIKHSKQDENHEWFFMRDGKKCKLFDYEEGK